MRPSPAVAVGLRLPGPHRAIRQGAPYTGVVTGKGRRMPRSPTAMLAARATNLRRRRAWRGAQGHDRPNGSEWPRAHGDAAEER
jgi:hypothetical protein